MSALFFTKSNIYCITWKMHEDLAFLWMTELIFSCIATVNCFTSVVHGVWHLWTGFPAQDDCTTYHNSSAFLGFASETAFLKSPHKFSIGLKSGDWAGHSIHNLFKYLNVLKLIHDPWNAINRPTTWYEKPPHIMMLVPPCFTVFVFGGRLTNCLDPKRTILLYQSTKYCGISL